MQLLDLLEVHVVLASTPQGLLGLPHLTARLAAAGKPLPRVYCTAAALDVAAHMAVDLHAVHAAVQDCVVVLPSSAAACQAQPAGVASAAAGPASVAPVRGWVLPQLRMLGARSVLPCVWCTVLEFI